MKMKFINSQQLKLKNKMNRKILIRNKHKMKIMNHNLIPLCLTNFGRAKRKYQKMTLLK